MDYGAFITMFRKDQVERNQDNLPKDSKCHLIIKKINKNKGPLYRRLFQCKFAFDTRKVFQVFGVH